MTEKTETAVDRAAKAEALLLRFAAEAHRRKWSYDRGLDDDGVPIKSEAFDALHRLGEEMRVELDKLRADTPAAAAVRPPATDRTALRQRVAAALVRYDWNAGLSGRVTPSEHHYGEADAVLAALPAPADRAAEWNAAAEFVEAMNEGCGRKPCDACTTREDIADALRDAARRMAAVPAAVSGRADNETRVLQSEPEPPTPRCAHCRHPKRDHDGHADHRERYSPLVAGGPWCHACNVECDYAAVPAVGGAQPKETRP